MSDAVVHIVYPGVKLREVFDGKKTKVKALCGAFVAHRPAHDAPVCRDCFVAYHELESKAEAEAASQQATQNA